MKEIFASADAGMFGMLLFLFIFICMLIWVFYPGSKEKFKSFGNIPFKDDSDER